MTNQEVSKNKSKLPVMQGNKNSMPIGNKNKVYDLTHLLYEAEISELQVFLYFNPVIIGYYLSFSLFEIPNRSGGEAERIYLFKSIQGSHKFFSKRELRVIKPLEMIFLFINELDSLKLKQIIDEIKNIVPGNYPKFHKHADTDAISHEVLNMAIIGGCVPIDHNIIEKTQISRFGTNKYAELVLWSTGKNSFAFPLKDLSGNYANVVYYSMLKADEYIDNKIIYFNQNDGFWINKSTYVSETYEENGLEKKRQVSISTNAIIFCDPKFIIEYYQKYDKEANQDDIMLLIEQEELTFSYYLKSRSLLRNAHIKTAEILVSNTRDSLFALKYISFYYQQLLNTDYMFHVEKENGKIVLIETINIFYSKTKRELLDKDYIDKYMLWQGERETMLQNIISADFADVIPSNLNSKGINTDHFFPSSTLQEYKIDRSRSNETVLLNIKQITIIPYSYLWLNAFIRLITISNKSLNNTITITTI